VVVTGWAGEATRESGITMLEHCEACGHTTYSDCTCPKRLIDLSLWDGSDFFIVWPLPKFVFVTDKVAELVRREEYSGVRLLRVGDLAFGGTGFTPGPPPPGRVVRGPEAFPGVEVTRLPDVEA
jgi:hypothetical protein